VPVFAALPTSISKGLIVPEGCFLNCVTNAVRVHKSQGTSLARPILNFNESESVLGLSYVTVSRVKALGGLMFESAFDLSRFKEVKGKTLKDRAEDIRIKNGQLSPAGQLFLSVATMIEYPTY
jgi:hypothetical protein